jgi:uncharacterized protein YbaR (Trm112 family)
MNQELLDILVCPVCKGKLSYHPTEEELVCPVDKLGYPIKNDVPVLISTEARPL